MKKIIKYTLYMIVLIVTFCPNVKAGVNVSASSQTVTVGNSVKITVSSPDVVGKFSITSSNNNILSGGSSGAWLEGSITYTFTTKNAGTATISVVPIDAATNSGNYTQVSTITITVKAKQVVVLSSNNNLSSLGIDGVSIAPEFNKDTIEYAVELEPGTEKVNISAGAEDSNATITGNGERTVTDGENSLEIVVTAQNGATKTYVIKATVKEFNPITVKISNKEYTVVRKKSSLTPPSNYEETTVKLNEEEIPAYKSKITNYTLVALKDSEGNQNWYVYDKNNYTLYKEYTFGKTILYPMIMDEIPEGYKKTSIKYNDDNIVAYKLNEKSKYALLYAMNVETGEKHLYMYDSKEDSVQIYNDEYINKLVNENNMYLKILIGVSTGLVLSVGIIIFILVKNRKNKKSQK